MHGKMGARMAADEKFLFDSGDKRRPTAAESPKSAAETASGRMGPAATAASSALDSGSWRPVPFESGRPTQAPHPVGTQEPALLAPASAGQKPSTSAGWRATIDA